MAPARLSGPARRDAGGRRPRGALSGLRGPVQRTGAALGRLELAGYAATVTADALFRLAALVVVAILVASVGGFALAVAVSAGVAAAVAWRRVRRLARQAMPAPSGERLSATSILGGSARLVVGALGMQLLVNSGPLIARAESSVETMEFAGHLLAAMTLARVPVFILQSLQATYLARSPVLRTTTTPSGCARPSPPWLDSSGWWGG